MEQLIITIYILIILHLINGSHDTILIKMLQEDYDDFCQLGKKLEERIDSIRGFSNKKTELIFKIDEFNKIFPHLRGLNPNEMEEMLDDVDSILGYLDAILV